MITMDEAVKIIEKMNPNKDDKVVSCFEYKDDFIVTCRSDDEDDVVGVTMAVNKNTGKVQNYNLSMVITQKLIIDNDEEFEEALNSGIHF